MYPLEGVKRLNFEDFCRVVSIMESKKHLTNEGLDEIKQIKKGMNKGRIC
jgi:hypothetical protein